MNDQPVIPVNLTPHKITVKPPVGDFDITPDPRGPARVTTSPGADIKNFNNFPLRTSPTFGEVQGLPAPEAPYIYVVSAIVAARCVGRADVFSPDTGPDAIRENGQVVAVRRLLQAPQS